MFDLKLSAPEDDTNDALAAAIFQEATPFVRTWLESNPNSETLISNLPALKLALAAYIKNHDLELFQRMRAALERVNRETAFAALPSAILAEFILLNLHAFQLGMEDMFRKAAHRALEEAVRRFDEPLEYFKSDASDVTQLFYTEANAKLGETFYLAWRVLDDQALRPKAGDVLGQVSAMFDPRAGLFQRAELPEGARKGTRNLDAYAAAVQMFLTATETTGRATYVIRARIIADFVLEQMNQETERAALTERVAFAEALTRLEQFTGEIVYRQNALRILETIRTMSAPRGSPAAAYALAVEHAQHFPLHVVIIGDVENDENARALWQTALNAYASARAIEVLQPRQHQARIQSLGYSASKESALAYICIEPVCLPPVRSAQEFQKAIQRARFG